MAKAKPRKKKSSLEKVEVHYLKTSNYRTFHVDGIFGGLTPIGKVYIELFIQRSVTPQIIQHEINEDGTLGKEIMREGKKGIIREIESGLIMDIEVAKVLRTWLDEKIKEFEKFEKLVGGRQ